MDWFERLTSNPFIESVILADNQGHILRSNRTLRSDNEVAASMLQSAEVLAQTLAEELGCGAAQMLQISTQSEHIMLFPVENSTYYLVIQIARTAPLMLIMVDVERAIEEIALDELIAVRRVDRGYEDDTPVLDAAELIQAVQDWLHGKQTE